MSKSTAFTTILLFGVALTGCNTGPAPGEAAVKKGESVSAPREVLARLRDLEGEYRLDHRGRVWALSFRRCPLNDGDLEILRSLPHIRTLTLRGISVGGGRLTVEGLRPLKSLHELRRLDLNMNHRFTGTLDSIACLSKLEFLDLRGTELGDEAMQAIASVPTLRVLHLGHLGLTEQGLRHLHKSSLEEFDYWFRNDQDVALLGGLKRLRAWHIGYGDIPVHRLAEFAGADQLQEITLTCDGAGCRSEAIDAIRSMRSLQKLQISCSADARCSILGALDSLPELKALRLVGVSDQTLQQLPHIKTLEALDLALTAVGTGESLQRLAALPSLRHLALPPGTTTADGLASVACCSHLETLVFEPNQIGDFLQILSWPRLATSAGFAAKDLRPVLRHTPLRTLKLNGLGFDDELMKEMTTARDLRCLEVSGLPITDVGIRQLHHLKHLQLLDIAGTLVTIDAARSLHRSLPQCRITDNWCCGCMAIEPRVP